MEALAEKASEIKKLGASLVLIAPQLEMHNRAIKEEKGLEVDILSDPGNEVAERYGIRFTLPSDVKAIYQQFKIDLGKYNGDDSWALPMPTRLIIDNKGVVRYAEINPDYTIRPDPEETIAALKNIV